MKIGIKHQNKKHFSFLSAKMRHNNVVFRTPYSQQVVVPVSNSPNHKFLSEQYSTRQFDFDNSLQDPCFSNSPSFSPNQSTRLQKSRKDNLKMILSDPSLSQSFVLGCPNHATKVQRSKRLLQESMVAANIQRKISLRNQQQFLRGLNLASQKNQCLLQPQAINNSQESILFNSKSSIKSPQPLTSPVSAMQKTQRVFLENLEELTKQREQQIHNRMHQQDQFLHQLEEDAASGRHIRIVNTRQTEQTSQISIPLQKCESEISEAPQQKQSIQFSNDEQINNLVMNSIDTHENCNVIVPPNKENSHCFSHIQAPIGRQSSASVRASLHSDFKKQQWQGKEMVMPTQQHLQVIFENDQVREKGICASQRHIPQYQNGQQNPNFNTIVQFGDSYPETYQSSNCSIQHSVAVSRMNSLQKGVADYYPFLGGDE